jgi:lysophospholipase L1-like esterase
MSNNETSFSYMKWIAYYLKNIWLIFGITLLLIISLEIISNIILYVYHHHNYYDQVKGYDNKDILWLDDYLKESGSSSLVKWEPFVYWHRKPFVGKYINIDQSGIRHTKQWNVSSKGVDKVINIFMLGGSTLWGVGARDDYTIPSLVARFLSEHGIKVNITNFGESGYVNTQEVIYLFLQLQKSNIPDIVIFYDGVNDVFSALQNGKAGIPVNESNRKMEFNIASNYIELLKALLRESATFRLCSKGARKLFNFNFDTALNRNDYHKVALDITNTYLSNIKLVNDMSCGKFTAMFYWQPVIYDKNHLTKYEQTQLRVDTQDLYNTVYAMIKFKAPIFKDYHFYNISDIFKDSSKPIFIDFCHVNEAGNEVIADKIANDIIDLIKK